MLLISRSVNQSVRPSAWEGQRHTGSASRSEPRYGSLVSTPPSKLPIGEARVNEAAATLRTPNQGGSSAAVLPRFVAWHSGPLPQDLALASGLDRDTLAQLQAQGLPTPVYRGASPAELGPLDPRLSVEEVQGLSVLAWAGGIALGLGGMTLAVGSLLFVAAFGPLAVLGGLAMGVVGPALGGLLVTKAHRSRSAKSRALRIAAQSKDPTPLQQRVRALALKLRGVDLPQIAERDLLAALSDLYSDLSERPNQARIQELEGAVAAVEDLLAPTAQAGQKSDPEAVLRLAQAAHQARGETR